MPLHNDPSLQRIAKRIGELKKRRSRIRKERRRISRKVKLTEERIFSIVTESNGDAEQRLRESDTLMQFSKMKNQRSYFDASLNTIHKNLRKLYAQADVRLTKLYNL